MPLYDYICAACGHRIEVMHGVHDHGPAQCPNCHAHALRKAITAPAVVFKGSGWAKKDRGTASRTKAAAAAGGGDRSGDASKSVKSESTATTESGGGPTTPSGSDASKSSSASDPAPTGGAGSSD